MKAIQTKVLPHTNTKPWRIKASAEGVKSEVWTCNELDIIRRKDGLEHITNHECAARIFAHLHKWGHHTRQRRIARWIVGALLRA